MSNKLRQSRYLVLMLILTLTAASRLQSAPENSKYGLGLTRANLSIAQNGQRLGYLQTSLLSYTFQWAFILTINRNLGADVFNSNFKKWLRNITTLPEVPDGDHWLTNYVGHPLMGATIYAFYKNRGFSDRASVAGTFLQSTLFEYTVEGWKQPPSGVDLIVTPIVGSLVGSQVGMSAFILSSSYAVSKYIFSLF